MILSTKQYTDVKELNDLFSLADSFREKVVQSLKGKVLAIVKDEPSTRTRVSFEVAMKRLGGEVVNIQLDKTTSIAKGETLEDTIKTISEYADAIVMRHSKKGMVSYCAGFSSVPVINAGDGDGEHPTQALLDLYTIKREVGRTSNLNVMMVGDLKCSRTVHSLIHLLCLYPDNTFIFVSPEDLKIPVEYIPQSNKFHMELELSEAIKNVDVDVLYMTRFQKERYIKAEEAIVIDWSKQPPAIKESRPPYYRLSEKDVANLSPECKVLHPLPRGEEIPVSFDSDSRAAYFRQVKNGMFVRMALLHNILK